MPPTDTAQELRPGDLVRVRPPQEIQATLDDHGCCEGLSYLPVVMNKHCGQTFRVRKRIDRFFDERRWRLLKVRNVVILDGAYCEPPKGAEEAWAGCDRTCFLFWKEAWLERLSPEHERS